MKRIDLKIIRRKRRKAGTRKRVLGLPSRPRMTVFRSNRHIYVQVVDDLAGRTLAAASTMDKAGKPGQFDHGGSNLAAATDVGKLIAERAKSAGVEQVVFDRNGFLFHGRVKALADAAREAGLKF